MVLHTVCRWISRGIARVKGEDAPIPPQWLAQHADHPQGLTVTPVMAAPAVAPHSMQHKPPVVLQEHDGNVRVLHDGYVTPHRTLRE